MFDRDEVPPFHSEDRYISLDDVLELIEEERIRGMIDDIDYEDLRDNLLARSKSIEVLAGKVGK